MLRVSARRLPKRQRSLHTSLSITMAVKDSKLYTNGAPHGVRDGQKAYNNWPNDAGVRSSTELDVSSC